MKGDFSRVTFDKAKHFSRVLMQQGRVQLDADWNEQAAILLHYLRALAVDLGSEHWGPTSGTGFEITSKSNDFTISAGRYYVQGILCENNEEKLTYTNQPDYPLKEKEALGKGDYLVYLDVWERHLTYIEDDLIREVALAGPDTATRAKIVWQVKLLKVANSSTNGNTSNLKQNYEAFLDAIKNEIKPGSGKLRARARKQKDTDEPCLTSPEARYRGAENQLYRVEIHKGGTADGATFKWSRENGSVIFPIVSGGGTNTLTLENLGRDNRFGLREGDWVEVQDDDYVLHNCAGNLLQIQSIDRTSMTVTLSGTPDPNAGKDLAKHPLLRRWDHKKGDPTDGGLQLANDGAALIVEDVNKWLSLEDGAQIQFPPLTSATGTTAPLAEYRTGDYWLIPARIATGDAEWPGPMDNPTALPPHGVAHYYAPLAMIPVDNVGNVTGTVTDLRRKLNQLWS